MHVDHEFLTQLRHKLGNDLKLVHTEPVSGGDINQAHYLKTSKGDFFLKQNSSTSFPHLFELEEQGLNALRNSNFLIPTSFGTLNWESESGLLLEWLVSGRMGPEFWKSFGKALASLHRCTNPSFGWEESNYIGSLVQVNDHEEDWISFFVNQRLDPMLQRAFDQNLASKSLLSQFDRLYHKLDRWIPNEKPALVHGDLWSGNFMIGPQGQPVLIDPAVYYGHREMDLAMSFLFGGFDPSYVDAYNEDFPLEEGWQERLDLHNLYPLLVHLNLFGASYQPQIEGILRHFL